MKGIVLAGGSGTRMRPASLAISKQLIPIYDKPMIYYSLSIQMLAGIQNILLVTTPHDQKNFQNLLGNGSQWGINLEYAIQKEPKGIAEAFIIGKDFIQNQSVSLVLGDNILYGDGLIKKLRKATELKDGALVFGYRVKDPERYGVIELKDNKIISIEEKPSSPKSNIAITGLYFYDNQVIDYAKNMKPSLRGELEITDINNQYIQKEKLEMMLLGRGVAWLDTGTHRSIMDASNFISSIENRQGLKVSCLEEIAFNNGWISENEIIKAIDLHKKSEYGEYLKTII